MNIDDFHPLERAILLALNSVEPSDFGEFCRGLQGYCPAKSDTRGWRALFGHIDRLRSLRLVYVEYETPDVDSNLPKIETIRLTDKSAAMVREKLDGERGLFSGIELREVTANEADAFLRSEDISVGDIIMDGCGHTHPCGDSNCIVPRPAPHKRPPGVKL